jgi:hypothetical protein
VKEKIELIRDNFKANSSFPPGVFKTIFDLLKLTEIIWMMVDAGNDTAAKLRVQSALQSWSQTAEPSILRATIEALKAGEKSEDEVEDEVGEK